MPIITIPDPRLKKKSKLIKKVDKKILGFIDDLKETLVKSEDPPGVGISAPQVGKNWQIFLIRTEDNIEVFINPKITKKSKKMVLGANKKEPRLEGCLSIPKIYGPVKRHQWLELEYLSLDKNQKPVEKKAKLKDFSARVAQHEYDHLEGVLFTERVAQQGGQLYVEKDEKLVPIRSVENA